MEEAKKARTVSEKEYRYLERIKKANSLADELAKVIDPLSPYQKAEIIERALLPCPMDILKILRIR